MRQIALRGRRLAGGQVKTKEKTRKKSSRVISVILSLALLIGIGLLLYPTVADQWNKVHATRAIANYLEQTEAMDAEAIREEIEEALAYNRELAEKGFLGDLSAAQEERYNRLLSVNGSNIMGYITIDKIDCKLPLYHGTKDEVLEVGTGHLSWSSLPIGAASWDNKNETVDPDDGAHTMISGHRGLPSAKLFTDLDKLEEGDLFVLSTLNQILAYEVDQIRVILPDDLSGLRLEPGHDYCTLITCTPYGVNSHRLLVRGHRVSADENMFRKYHIQNNAIQYAPALIAPMIAAPFLAILFATAMIMPGFRRKRQRIDENVMDELEVADLPLQKLDLSVREINRLVEGLRIRNVTPHLKETEEEKGGRAKKAQRKSRRGRK